MSCLAAVLMLGLVVGRLVEALGIPQVVGYILAGIVLGASVTDVLPVSLLEKLSSLTYTALGFIGFMVGGELRRSVFERYGKQFVAILLGEGLLAMAVVALLTVLWTGNLALGLLLGALCSATAPAATVDVLWEYRSRGPLTTTLLVQIIGPPCVKLAISRAGEIQAPGASALV